VALATRVLWKNAGAKCPFVQRRKQSTVLGKWEHNARIEMLLNEIVRLGLSGGKQKGNRHHVPDCVEVCPGQHRSPWMASEKRRMSRMVKDCRHVPDGDREKGNVPDHRVQSRTVWCKKGAFRF
jgi:hypothetical protein